MKILYPSLITVVKPFTKLTLVIAMVAWLVIPSFVYATDTKVYPGASCQSFVGVFAADFTSQPQGIFNRSPDANRNVTCPIVTDNNTITEGEEVFVLVFVQSANSRRLDCTAFNSSLFGNTLSSVNDFTSSNFPDVLTMSLRVADGGFVNSLLCTLPPSGVIFSYVVVEPKNENDE
jgi:hypothetical protein